MEYVNWAIRDLVHSALNKQIHLYFVLFEIKWALTGTCHLGSPFHVLRMGDCKHLSPPLSSFKSLAHKREGQGWQKPSPWAIGIGKVYWACSDQTPKTKQNLRGNLEKKLTLFQFSLLKVRFPPYRHPSGAHTVRKYLSRSAFRKLAGPRALDLQRRGCPGSSQVSQGLKWGIEKVFL